MFSGSLQDGEGVVVKAGGSSVVVVEGSVVAGSVVSGSVGPGGGSVEATVVVARSVVEATVVAGSVVEATVVAGSVVEATVVAGSVVEVTVVAGSVVEATVVAGSVVETMVVEGMVVVVGTVVAGSLGGTATIIIINDDIYYLFYYSTRNIIILCMNGIKKSILELPRIQMNPFPRKPSMHSQKYPPDNGMQLALEWQLSIPAAQKSKKRRKLGFFLSRHN